MKGTGGIHQKIRISFGGQQQGIVLIGYFSSEDDRKIKTAGRKEIRIPHKKQLH